MVYYLISALNSLVYFVFQVLGCSCCIYQLVCMIHHEGRGNFEWMRIANICFSQGVRPIIARARSCPRCSIRKDQHSVFSSFIQIHGVVHGEGQARSIYRTDARRRSKSRATLMEGRVHEIIASKTAGGSRWAVPTTFCPNMRQQTTGEHVCVWTTQSF